MGGGHNPVLMIVMIEHLLLCTHWILCSIDSNSVLLEVAIVSFVISHLFEKWFQYISNVSVRADGCVVK
jgi:hypothetical protein